MFNNSILPIQPSNEVVELVEQKRGYNLDSCELHVYETRKEVARLPITFEGFTVTSMLKGVKKVRFNDGIKRNYVPGNTIIVPNNYELNIDFPEASFSSPTQCAALIIDTHYAKQQLDKINEHNVHNTLYDHSNILNQPLLINNTKNLIALHSKIIGLSTSSERTKEQRVKSLINKLIKRASQLYCVEKLRDESISHKNNNPFSAIINFIQENIHREIHIKDLIRVSNMSRATFYRVFVKEIGISPNKLIINERIALAKKLITENNLSIKETAYAVGFSSPNYFIRLFKKYEGITPKRFSNSFQHFHN
jgi:AraC-like DNA-binding protein